MQTTATPVSPLSVTFEQAFKAALADTRRAGVKVRQNVMMCCRGCITGEKVGVAEVALEHTPLVYTYGGQGNAYTFIDGLPHDRAKVTKIRRRGFAMDFTRARVDVIYFNHAGPGVVAAQALADALRKHGLTVDWNGTENECVIVRVPQP